MVVNLSLAKTIKWGQFFGRENTVFYSVAAEKLLSIESHIWNNNITMILALAPNITKDCVHLL